MYLFLKSSKLNPKGLFQMDTYQCAAKGLQRSKLNGKLFNSLNLTEASIYTNSNHSDTVGRHMPLSEMEK